MPNLLAELGNPTGGSRRPLQTSRGQGAASAVNGDMAALDDRGGDDTYRLIMDQTLERDIRVTDPCTCASAGATVYGATGGTLIGQGASRLTASGYLLDARGNDSYVAIADQRLSVTLDDRLENPSTPPSLEVVGFWSPVVVAQGGAEGGIGVLLEGSGTDRYDLRIQGDTEASGTSQHADGVPVVTALVAGPSGNGQGASSGVDGGAAFLDLAGSGDRIESAATSRVSAAPDPDGAFLRAGIWPRVQGAGSEATFLVMGEGPIISSEPSRPACSPNADARRGFGTWTECPVGLRDADPEHQSFDVPGLGSPAVGHAPGSTGAAPSLSITPDTPREAPADDAELPTPDTVILPVGARLLGPDGAPLAGRRIHFTLQLDYGTAWPIVWQVDAVTDGDGIARGRLPLLMTGLQPEGPWRVAATFDGDSTLYARHAALPLALGP